MTPEQMQQRSSEKVQQVLSLMKTLHIAVEAKERIDPKSGFIEKMVFWIDNEKYPAPDQTGPTGETHA